MKNLFNPLLKAGLQKVPDNLTDIATRNASDITNIPAGNISSTDVQSALNELDTEKSVITHTHDHGTLTGLADDDHTQYVLKSGSIAQITTRSHTALTDIGINTHVQVDTHITNSALNAHGATATTDLNFAKYKAIAMACDNGSTLPASPVIGQWFLHTPTGRNILMMYDGSAWIPIISMGIMTLYVSTTGTNDQAHGTGTGTNAFLTIQYAINTIPGLIGGNVVVNIGAGTFSEKVTILGKNYMENYTITLAGALTQSATATMDSAVQGTGATQGSITDAGAFGSYDNKLIYANSEYRIIDSDSANTATITGVWSALPSGTYYIYDWGTIIDGTTETIEIGTGQNGIVISNIKLTGASSRIINMTPNSTLILNQCWLAVNSGQGIMSDKGLFFVELNSCFVDITSASWAPINAITGASININRTKLLDSSGGSGYIIEVVMCGIIWLRYGSIIDGKSAGGTTAGCYLTRNGVINYYNTAADGYNIIRNCSTGILCTEGAVAVNTSTNQYSGNTTNENGNTGTDGHGYID